MDRVRLYIHGPIWGQGGEPPPSGSAAAPAAGPDGQPSFIRTRPRFGAIWGEIGRVGTIYREERKTAAGGHERSESGPYLPSTPSNSRQEPPNGSALDNVSALAPSARQSQQDAGNGPQRPEEPEPVQTITEDPRRAQRRQYEATRPRSEDPTGGGSNLYKVRTRRTSPSTAQIFAIFKRPADHGGGFGDIPDALKGNRPPAPWGRGSAQRRRNTETHEQPERCALDQRTEPRKNNKRTLHLHY